MTDVFHPTKIATAWKRLRRAFLRTAFGNLLLSTSAGGLVGAGLGWLFYNGTTGAGAMVIVFAIYGVIFALLFKLLIKEKLFWPLLRGLMWFAAAFIVLTMIFAAVQPLWKSYKSSRTAVVRTVFLHPADARTGPQVYVNDGTVWALEDAPGNVRMIRGDEVRYVFVHLPQAFKADLGNLNSIPTVPDVCSLQDVTTGYSTEAVRLSAPFNRSSCPAQ